MENSFFLPPILSPTGSHTTTSPFSAAVIYTPVINSSKIAVFSSSIGKMETSSDTGMNSEMCFETCSVCRTKQWGNPPRLDNRSFSLYAHIFFLFCIRSFLKIIFPENFDLALPEIGRTKRYRKVNYLLSTVN